MNAWEAIGNMVRAQGVDFVFGIGDTDLLLFAEEAGLKPITTRYEGSAPFMAMAKQAGMDVEQFLAKCR